MNITKAFEELNNISTKESLLEKYNLSEADFDSQESIDEFISYLNHNDSLLFEMANLRGNDIKVEEKIPFSLFISSSKAVHGVHAIRVKVLWNSSKMTANPDGQMYLHGDYEYEAFSHKYKPTAKEIDILRKFCKKYKVIFAAIWESKLDAVDFIKYLEGNYSFSMLLSKIEPHEEEDPEDIDYYNINHCKSLKELEELVRKDNLWSMND